MGLWNWLLLFTASAGSGIAAFCCKQAFRSGTQAHVQWAWAVMITVFMVVIVLPVLLLMKCNDSAGDLATRGWVWMAAAAGFGTMSGVLSMSVLGKMDVGIVAPVMSMAPALTFMLGVLVLNEPLSGLRVWGTGLVVAGAILLGLGGRG